MKTFRAKAHSRKLQTLSLISSLVLITIGVFILTQNLEAQPRDLDGTRMQAQKVSLGTTHKDKLSPPADTADWRYIQIEKNTRLTITVSSEPADQNTTVTLTTATGNELAQASSNKGRLEITRQLEPGIYYINIQSGGPISYRMSIQ